MRKIFFKMFDCMARGEEKSELISDELPELQAKEETEWTPKNFHTRSGSRFILTAVC